MTPRKFMLIAGEPSGDILASELVDALRQRLLTIGQPEPRFVGVGGPRMAAAGVRLDTDLTHFAIIGLADVVRNLWRLRGILGRTVDYACAEQPDAIVCVDYGGFNRRFAAAIRSRQRGAWRPRLVQYVSPQVWASRPNRARTLARDLDLLVSILPMEKAWYQARFPRLRVEFVGHPILDRHPEALSFLDRFPADSHPPEDPPQVLLLPGSRPSEIAHHWPVVLGAARLVQPRIPVRWLAVFNNDSTRDRALAMDPAPDLPLGTRIGGLDKELPKATVAVAATGTVTLECALWRVPTVAIYKASWSTYQIARRIIKVRHLAMPNLLAPAPVMPELLQHHASPERVAQAVLGLLRDPAERNRIRVALAGVIRGLGSPGAASRAAEAVLSLLQAAP